MPADDGPNVETSDEMSDGATDSQLLSRARSDGEAFAIFFDRNYLPVLEHFVRHVGAGEDATDLCAETFAAALDGLDRFDPAMGNGRQWLYGIARNLLFRYWRDLRVSRDAQQRLGITQIVVDQGTLAAMSQAEARADGRFIDNAVRTLPDSLRTAIRLRIDGQLSYEEIAEDLGCTVDTARQRVHRGLTRLKKTYGGEL